MPILANCKCGKQIQANDDQAGKTVMCPVCWRDVMVPTVSDTQPLPPEKPAAPPPPPVESAAGPLREHAYWFLPVFFLPLAFGLGQKEEDFEERVRQTLAQLPAAKRQQIERVRQDPDSAPDEWLHLLPDQRLVGAYLPRNSLLQWGFAVLSAGAYLAVIGSCFQLGAARPRDLLLVGLFTGTLGISFLFLAHEIPFVAIFLAFCSFREAADPDFLTVLAANTLAVGLFEETIKQIPLIWYLRRFGSITWRQACLWGLASGAGFGIMEGIEYSRNFYNGVSPALAYLERFASCVAIHAVLAAAAGLTLFRNQALFHELQDNLVKPGLARMDADFETFVQQWLVYGLVALRAVAVVMFLHGLFNTSLTVEMPFVTVLTAGASFGWLAWLIESCRREEAAAAGGQESGARSQEAGA